ncbi:hypothetical protein GV791_29390 [Nocardia cyriacigeorgica]|uniref:Uncharacterized protein n=1 Tax=Nocardia cyriacigeorgica TaxID=135487 RepID=A0A6P1CY95_9NOCA|nr:hypothetical protein [Nocardia cyriacigeorgica]NEW36643.1 hypothetical protein [Nocardia cyriacigeorgica]
MAILGRPLGVTISARSLVRPGGGVIATTVRIAQRVIARPAVRTTQRVITTGAVRTTQCVIATLTVRARQLLVAPDWDGQVARISARAVGTGEAGQLVTGARTGLDARLMVGEDGSGAVGVGHARARIRRGRSVIG